MNPSTGSNIHKFSACSVGNICSAIGRNSVQTSCFVANKGITTVGGSQCGNSVVESGEECDCGGPSGCGSNPCCDPTTCKFTRGSFCDPSNEECCTKGCQLASNGTVCRASTGICDPQEVFSGTVASCPANTAAPDGTFRPPFPNSLLLKCLRNVVRQLQLSFLRLRPVHLPRLAMQNHYGLLHPR
jgi:hypothetical protein